MAVQPSFANFANKIEQDIENKQTQTLMKGLKTRRWLLATTCALCCAPIWAEDYTEDGVIYDVNQSTKTATVKGPANETVLLLNILRLQLHDGSHPFVCNLYRRMRIFTDFAEICRYPVFGHNDC